MSNVWKPLIAQLARSARIINVKNKSASVTQCVWRKKDVREETVFAVLENASNLSVPKILNARMDAFVRKNSKNNLDQNLTVILIRSKNIKIYFWIFTKDNKCVCELDGKKVCRGHKQCTGNDGAQKCVNKICEDVECRNFRHCEKISAITGKDYECTDENDADPNKCVEIECRAHATCGEKKVCIENKCVDTECRVNSVSLSLRS